MAITNRQRAAQAAKAAAAAAGAGNSKPGIPHSGSTGGGTATAMAFETYWFTPYEQQAMGHLAEQRDSYQSMMDGMRNHVCATRNLSTETTWHVRDDGKGLDPASKSARHKTIHAGTHAATHARA